MLHKLSENENAFLDRARELQNRGLSRWWEKEVRLDVDVAYFLLHNLNGKLLGYQRYDYKSDKHCTNPTLARYFTIVTKEEVGVWGLHSLLGQNTLYITEGVFDAVSLHNLGLAAVAVLCNNPQKLTSFLGSLPQRTVAVCDGDKAGRKLAKCCDRAVYLPEGKDANDLSLRELKSILERDLKVL